MSGNSGSRAKRLEPDGYLPPSQAWRSQVGVPETIIQTHSKKRFSMFGSTLLTPLSRDHTLPYTTLHRWLPVNAFLTCLGQRLRLGAWVTPKPTSGHGSRDRLGSAGQRGERIEPLRSGHNRVLCRRGRIPGMSVARATCRGPLSVRSTQRSLPTT